MAKSKKMLKRKGNRPNMEDFLKRSFEKIEEA